MGAFHTQLSPLNMHVSEYTISGGVHYQVCSFLHIQSSCLQALRSTLVKNEPSLAEHSLFLLQDAKRGTVLQDDESLCQFLNSGSPHSLNIIVAPVVAEEADDTIGEAERDATEETDRQLEGCLGGHANVLEEKVTGVNGGDTSHTFPVENIPYSEMGEWEILEYSSKETPFYSYPVLPSHCTYSVEWC